MHDDTWDTQVEFACHQVFIGLICITMSQFALLKKFRIMPAYTRKCPAHSTQLIFTVPPEPAALAFLWLIQKSLGNIHQSINHLPNDCHSSACLIDITYQLNVSTLEHRTSGNCSQESRAKACQAESSRTPKAAKDHAQLATYCTFEARSRQHVFVTRLIFFCRCSNVTSTISHLYPHRTGFQCKLQRSVQICNLQYDKT